MGKRKRWHKTDRPQEIPKAENTRQDLKGQTSYGTQGRRTSCPRGSKEEIVLLQDREDPSSNGLQPTSLLATRSDARSP